MPAWAKSPEQAPICPVTASFKVFVWCSPQPELLWARGWKLLLRWWRPQSHAGPTLLGIDEFHPCLLKGTADRLIISPGPCGGARRQFGTTNGGDAHRRVAGEVFRGAADEGADRADLRCGWRRLCGWQSGALVLLLLPLPQPDPGERALEAAGVKLIDENGGGGAIMVANFGDSQQRTPCHLRAHAKEIHKRTQLAPSRNTRQGQHQCHESHAHRACPTSSWRSLSESRRPGIWIST